MRTLASIQQISAIDDIPGADNIVVASILGWKVVIRRGEFQVNDKVIYLEIDSWVPNTIAPFLSRGNEPREYEGVKGERLRSVKLKAQISQGLVLPLSLIPESYGYSFHAPIGEDVTDILGIKKYEPPIPAALAGTVRGNWPSFLQKTDETRIQAIPHILDKIRGMWVVGHEKLDGSSMTVYKNDGDFGVCSRNLNLTETDGNAFWQIARKYDLKNTLGDGFCIQGELVGPGVQGNKYNLSELDFYVFNVFDIKNGKYLNTEDAKKLAESWGLKWVPCVTKILVTDEVTVDSLLAFAEGKSALNLKQEREGLVWRTTVEQEIFRIGRGSFKTISNKFLLAGGD